MSYPVNRDLWESLESIFLAKARELVKEIAEDLGKPEKLLWNEVVKDKIHIHIIEQDETAEECMELVYCDKVAQRCRKPVYLGTSFCPQHELSLSRSTKTTHASTLPALRRIKLEDGSIIFYDRLTQDLYDSNYRRCGYKTENGLVVFKLEET
jgi:hypothetical protein